MLPDFPLLKSHVRRTFLQAVRKQIPFHEPLLKDVRSTTLHEGVGSRLTRSDGSSAPIDLKAATAALTIDRQQMKRIDLDGLLKHVSTMAEQFASQQARLMFSTISEAADEVGNTVSTADAGLQAAFLEMQRKLHVDFDPDTLEPKGMVMVIHPSQAQAWMAQAEAWEKDPVFVSEMATIRKQQIEAWRAREDSRKLVD